MLNAISYFLDNFLNKITSVSKDVNVTQNFSSIYPDNRKPEQRRSLFHTPSPH